MLSARQQTLGSLRQALKPPSVCPPGLGAAVQVRGGFYEGSNKDHRQISMPVPRNVRPNIVVKGLRKISAKMDILKTQTKIRNFEDNSMYRIRKLNERAYFRKWHYLRYAVETLNFYARKRAPLSILPKEDPSHLEMRLLNPVLQAGDASRKKARPWFKPDGFSEKELWKIADEVADTRPTSSGQRLSFECRGIARFREPQSCVSPEILKLCIMAESFYNSVMSTRTSPKMRRGHRQSSLQPPPEMPSESCCCLRPIAEVYSKVIRHASCFICQRHGVWAVDLNREDIIESGWLWKKSKVVGTWRLRWCCVVMSKHAILSFEREPDWIHNTNLQQSPTEKIPLDHCDLQEIQDQSPFLGFTVDKRVFALPSSPYPRTALVNWLMAIAFVKGDQDTINRCMSLACEDVALRDNPSRGEFSDIDSVVSTAAPSSATSSSSSTFAMYVHGTTGDHVTSDCLKFADLWLIPLASNRAYATTSCELCHRLRGRRDLCETRVCGHIFHVECLYSWVRQSIIHDYCPLCRTPFCGPLLCDDGDEVGHAYTEACPSSIMTFSYRRPVRLNSYGYEAFYSLPASPVQRFPPLELPKKASPPAQATESLPQPMPMDRLRWRS